MSVFDGLAAAADHAAGSVDEAVARATDDEPGGGLVDGAAGVADHAAGSVDEAVGRSFDDEAGGGVFDGIDSVADHAAGSIDESVARQFDDEKGGGFADMAGNVSEPVADVAGDAYSDAAAVADDMAGPWDELLGGSSAYLVAAVVAGVLLLYAQSDSDISAGVV
ncbi:hypothetical protein RYH80_05655 [Halobaculum sp. MBLA0147]|uniref:hypothetical protein n=1 Tax=Halobaculum sp. MBLA0147 TaxID=3079934 RepID=UPI0035235C77